MSARMPASKISASARSIKRAARCGLIGRPSKAASSRNLLNFAGDLVAFFVQGLQGVLECVVDAGSDALQRRCRDHQARPAEQSEWCIELLVHAREANQRLPMVAQRVRQPRRT